MTCPNCGFEIIDGICLCPGSVAFDFNDEAESDDDEANWESYYDSVREDDYSDSSRLFYDDYPFGAGDL